MRRSQIIVIHKTYLRNAAGLRETLFLQTKKKCIIFLLTTYWEQQIEHQQLK